MYVNLPQIIPYKEFVFKIMKVKFTPDEDVMNLKFRLNTANYKL